MCWVKAPGLTGEPLGKLPDLRIGGGSRTLGVAVKCGDIQGNAGGEGGSLADS